MEEVNQCFRKRKVRNKKERLRFYFKNGRRCWYCGKQLKKNKFRLDHQQPFSQGGSCKLNENMVLACKKCDSAKGNLSVEQFRKVSEQEKFYGES